MSFYRHLLRTRALRSATSTTTASDNRPSALFSLSRLFAFSSPDEAAAERRRRKRQLRIEPPTLRDPTAARPSRGLSAPRLPDSTASLVGPRLSLHNRVQTLIRSGDLDAASAHARHSFFSPIRPTVFTCNAVMSSMFRARRFDDVSALFHFFFAQQNIIPNVVSYNTLINSHCDAGQVDVALDVYRRMLATAPFPASTFTYRYLTKGLVASGRISDAVDMLREMLHRGHSSDALVYNNVIAGFVELGSMEKAIELFDELREQCQIYDGVVHATLMEGYWKLGKDREAMDCYQLLLDRQFRMTPATCNVLLATLLKHDKVIEAEKLFDQMLDEHKPPVYMGLNAETYTIMMNHYFEKGKFAEAIEVFQRTGVKPLPKDVGRYNYIIGKLCENGMLLDAVKLFDELLSQGIEPDTATYVFLANAYLNDSKIEDAMVFLDKIMSGGEAARKAAVAFCNKMFDGLVKTESVGRAMDVFRRMVASGIRPNAASYEILIAGLCNEGDLDNGRALYEEMMKSGIHASMQLQSVVSESFQKAGRGEEMETVLAAAAAGHQATAHQATSAQCVAGKVAPRAISAQQVEGGTFAQPNLQAAAWCGPLS